MEARPRLLIADDDPNMLCVLRTALERDFDVQTAPNGREAVRMAATGRPDVVLMDARMPGGDGFEACRTLRTSPSVGGVPIIMMTALRDSRFVKRAFESGASDLMLKPFSIAQVRTRARTWLMRSSHAT
ncbi:MAG: response regulator [Chloroflexota bacterium]